MRFLNVYIPILFLISLQVYSQSGSFDSNPAGSETQEPAAAESGAAIPSGYRSIQLRSSLEEVKKQLLVEPRFDFRGDPDVSIQKTGTQSLISTKGRMFIDQGFFQFDEGVLYLIILQLNPEKMDFFTMQQTLTKQYGPPADISPQGMYWSDGKTKLSLEYPLTLKYLDEEIFNSFLADEKSLKSFEEVSRNQFLKDF